MSSRRRSPRVVGTAGRLLLLGALLAADPAAAADDAAPPVRSAVDPGEICSVGSFRTQRAVGGFDVVFTNLSSRACRRVSYYCLWGMLGSTGFYQQSETGVFDGLIPAGESATVAEIRPRGGPADRDVVWSWCAVREPPQEPAGEPPRR